MNKKFLTFTLSLLLSQYLLADSKVNLGDVIVTAEKEESKIEKVPLSISILNAKNIDEYNILDTQDIVNSTPGLFMIKTNHHGTAGFLSLRGVTPTMEGSQTVGFFVDDVYTPMFDTEILDIQRVEVLKGPQSTLYGKNTEAGLINIITNKPQNEDSAELSLGFASNNTQTYKAIINKKIIDDKLFFRASLRKYLTDGYFHNDYNDSDDSDNIDGLDARASLRYIPNENLEFLLSYDKSDYETGYTGFNTMENVKNNIGDVNVDFEGSGDYTNDKLVLKSIYENDDFKFTSITAASKMKSDDKNDLDFSTYDIMRLGVHSENDFLSQEFRLNSTYNNLKYLVGIYLAKEKKITDIDFDMRQGIPSYGISPFVQNTDSTIDNKQYAFFTQANYEFSELFNITAGLRYDKDEKELDYKKYYSKDLSAFYMNDESEQLSYSNDQWLSKISFNFNVMNSLLYTSYSQGYKGGGFNSLAPSSYLTFEEETSDNYEIGIKSKFLNDKLFASFAMYQTNISNQQVELQLYPDSITSNAGKSTIKGFEFESKYQATDNLHLGAGIGFNNSKFDEYTDDTYDSSGVKTGEVDYSGNYAPNTPKYTYNISARYNIDKSYVLAKLNGISSMYYDSANTVQEDSYRTVDLTFGTQIKGFDLKLWSKNIFDEGYATRAFEFGDVWYARAGEPRTFGFELAKKF